MRATRPQDPQHTESFELLPWYATGTLEPAEHMRVEQHLQGCIACRNELRTIRTMETEMTSAPQSDPAIDAGWSRMKRRLHTLESGRARVPTLRAQVARWLASGLWIRGALLAQTALMLALASYVFLADPAPKYYHTLGASAQPATGRSTVIVAFDNAVAEGKIRSVLRRAEARIIDGPNREGVYTLEVPRERRQELLQELRRRDMLAKPEPVP